MLRKILVLSLLVFAVGCGDRKATVESLESNKRASVDDITSGGEPAEGKQGPVDLFFKRLNEADYDAIYKDTSDEFKRNETRDSASDKLKQLASYGKVHSYTRVQMPILDGGKTIQPVYVVLFDTARGRVTLTYVDQKGEWKLRGFELGLR